MRLDGKLRADGEGVGLRNVGELLQRDLRLSDGIEGKRRLVAAVIFPGGVFRVLFLEVRGIGEKKIAQLVRGGVGVNGAAEAVAHEAREVAGVVDVGVGEEDPVDGGGIDRKAFPVALLERLGAFEETAIDEELFVFGFDEVFGTGDGARGTQESDPRHRDGILGQIARRAQGFRTSGKDNRKLVHARVKAQHLRESCFEFILWREEEPGMLVRRSNREQMARLDWNVRGAGSGLLDGAQDIQRVLTSRCPQRCSLGNIGGRCAAEA